MKRQYLEEMNLQKKKQFDFCLSLCRIFFKYLQVTINTSVVQQLQLHFFLSMKEDIWGLPGPLSIPFPLNLCLCYWRTTLVLSVC